MVDRSSLHLNGRLPVYLPLCKSLEFLSKYNFADGVYTLSESEVGANKRTTTIKNALTSESLSTAYRLGWIVSSI